MRSLSNCSFDQVFLPPYLERRMPGFTMLEVCVVLFIIAVLFVVTMPVASRLLDEEKLQRPIRELQAFARTARRDAMMEDHSYEVLLLNDSYVLRPVDAAKDAKIKPITYGLPSGVTFSIKRLGEGDFKTQAEASWVFSSNGLCEPIVFLFQRGSDWVRCRVDPLTATLENEGSYIQ
jgi:prepilin-type N-terminal cleavage/methylation domain-containing protein